MRQRLKEITDLVPHQAKRVQEKQKAVYDRGARKRMLQEETESWSFYHNPKTI